MDVNLDINTFIEKELHKIIATLSDNTLFERLKVEEQSINKTIESYKKTAELEFKQEQNKILQKFTAKTYQVKSLIESLNNEKNSNLSAEYAEQIENALKELISKIEYEQENEIRLLNERINIKVETLINSYKEKIKDLPQKRVGELNKIIETKSKQLQFLDDFYETASFDAEIWKNTNQVLNDIIEEEKKEKEEKENNKHLRKEKKENSNLYPKINYLQFDEFVNEFNLFDTKIYYKIPKIESFFTKKSTSIIYKKHHRNNLKIKIDQIVLRFLMAADAGNILMYFVDSYSNGSLFFDYLNLPNEIFNKKIYTEVHEIDKVIFELQKIESEITQTQLKSYCINEYNNKFPKSCIPYRVVLFDNFPKGYVSNAMPLIEKLLRTGAEAGIHFVFIIEDSDVSDSNVQKILLQTNQINITDINEVQTKESIDLIKSNVIQIANKKFNKVKTLYFEDYFHDDFEWWTQKSAESLSVPIGVRGKDDFNLTFKGENAHCVITGTTGSGKSCFIHSLITSACLNYSPNELRLFLIDLKSGVEFQNYAFESLPHADFIALQSSPQYALHILALIQKKIEDRSLKFTEKGVIAKDLGVFKSKFPDEIMPRYLIIIDEYQQLFLNYDDKSRALGHLQYIAQQGRSYGFNLVLASQTTALGPEMMDNFGLKVLMKVRSLSAASELLGANVDSEYRSKAELLKPGQAFIPKETSVSKIQSYYLVEDVHVNILRNIKEKWDNYTGDKYDQNLIVFSREAPAYLENNKTVFKLNQKKKDYSTPLLFSPGEKVMVDGNDFMCKLRREKNNNLLFMGGKLDVSIRAVNGAFISLLSQLPSKDTQVDMFNYVNKYEKDLYENIRKSKDIINTYFPNLKYYEKGTDITEELNEVNNEIKNRLQNLDKENKFTNRLLIFYNIENNIDFHEVEKRPEDSLIMKIVRSDYTTVLCDILSNGPLVGIHCLVHTSNPSSYYTIFDADNKDHELFNHRIFGQISIEESEVLIHYSCREAAYVVDHGLAEKGHNRVIYFDSSLNVFNNLPVIKPYEFLAENDLIKILSTNKK